MTTTDPLTGPFKPSAWLTNSSDMPGYAKTADPAGTPSRARLLLMTAFGRDYQEG
jgi:hypothetical protein